MASACKESNGDDLTEYETWLKSELVSLNGKDDPWVVVDLVKQPVKVSWVKLE